MSQVSSNLGDAIAKQAASPKEATSDGQTVKMQNLSEVIGADRYLRSKDASKKPFAAIKRARFSPPGGS